MLWLCATLAVPIVPAPGTFLRQLAGTDAIQGTSLVVSALTPEQNGLQASRLAGWPHTLDDLTASGLI